MTSPPASTAGSPASAPATAPPSSRSDFHTPFSLSSSSSKHVMLHRWWLIKSDTDYAGKRLAIGGLNDHGNSMRRVFTSVPIVKRLDGWTLETADGFTVQIMGFIDQKRTRDNGILLEVSHKFRVGFPYNWEEYADGDFGETPTSPIQPLRCSGIDEQSENLHGEISKILDGLKALRRQDHVRKSGVDNAGGSEGEIGRKYSKESYANSMIEEEPNYSKDGSIAGITDIDGLSIPSNDVNPYGTSGRSAEADKKKRPCGICVQPGHYRTDCQLAKERRATGGVRVTRVTRSARVTRGAKARS